MSSFKFSNSLRYYFLAVLCFSFLISSNICLGQYERAIPKIGLTLSGGAVKGIAHVGVIKVLEEEGIIPDYITGTSIGAIIGGLYSMGYSADQLIEISKNTSWGYYFNDDWSRTSIPLDRRQQLEKYLLKLEWTKIGISLPRSLVFGEKLSLLLSSFTIPAHSIVNFDEFQIPFSCIATDISTGDPAILKSGDIGNALRASMSLPSIFEPIKIGDKTLVDGGISRNFPIEDVKEMGAEFVIAVDVEAGLFKTESITNALNMLDQTISFRINDSSKKQKELADIIIKPNLEGINGFSFDRVSDLLKLGEDAARAALPQINEKLRSIGYVKKAKQIFSHKKEFIISDYTIQSGKESIDKVIKSKLDIKEKKILTLEKLEKNVTNLFTTEWIRSLQYRLKPNENDTYTLDIKAEPRPSTWLKLGLNYDSDIKAGLGFGIFGRNILVNGSSGRINFRISENPMNEVNYNFPISKNYKTKININHILNFYPANAFSNGNLINQFKMHHFQANMNLSQEIGNNNVLSIGLGLDQITQNRKLYDPTKDENRLTQAILPIHFQHDSYDHKVFPSKGLQIGFTTNISISGKLERLIEQETDNFSKTNYLSKLSVDVATPISNNLISINSFYTGLINYETNNFINSFFLGRSLVNEVSHVSFVGLQYMAHPATRFAILKTQLRYELKHNIFLSIKANYGLTEIKIRKNIRTDQLLGTGLELGYKSPLGPIILTAEYGNVHKGLISYLHIGHYF